VIHEHGQQVSQMTVGAMLKTGQKSSRDRAVEKNTRPEYGNMAVASLIADAP
jgi:hypothetical protein